MDGQGEEHGAWARAKGETVSDPVVGFDVENCAGAIESFKGHVVF